MEQRYKNIPESFIYFDISPFINSIGEYDSVQFTLKHSGKFAFDVAFLADQLAIYPKAKIKIPSFTSVYALFTPQSYEQSSSEPLAKFKANLVSGRRLLDLSGGLGVDDWAFSFVFNELISIDIDADLNKIVRSNFQKLGVSTIQRLDADAYEFVDKNVDSYDWVYLDADRRAGAKRSFSLSEAQPNILTIKDKVFSFCPNILLKVSPMLDIHALISELKDVAAIWVVSSRNEVKEILVHLRKDTAIPEISAVELDSAFSNQYKLSFDAQVVNVTYANDGLFFYEPSLALIKADLASAYLREKKVNQVAKHSIYGVSDASIPDFFGRIFRLYDSFEFSKGKLKTYLANNGISKANISKRNFPMEVQEIRDLTGLKDGGEHYLFFTTDQQGNKRVFHCGK